MADTKQELILLRRLAAAVTGAGPFYCSTPEDDGSNCGGCPSCNLNKALEAYDKTLARW